MVFVQLQYILHAEFIGIKYLFGQFDITVQLKCIQVMYI